ncbi:hypothetical protein SeMB42_g05864 [Synchytrium endobioticum]|uniref:Glycylpeptide N-tetradecanoyltransferase n=1 Tax=Synchytrium endobioticum TaxID=286115 RepID=A0A507CNV1_9FUNG|nr:hypothetical protein SeMB42_g05864 [Synchytrium endobioticum]
MSERKLAIEETVQAPEGAVSSADASSASTAAAASPKKKGKKKPASTTDPSAMNGDEQRLLEMMRDGNDLQQLAKIGADVWKGSGKSGSSQAGVGGISTSDLAAMNSLLKRYNMNEMLQKLELDGHGRSTQRDMKSHKFWMTQPVVAYDEKTEVDGPIEPDKADDQVRQEPYTLPKDFEWCTVNIDDEKEVKELYELLSLNYVEDDDNMFRFDYSAAFLKWALKPPGWKPQWLIGVRVSSNRKLVAFISGIPATLRVRAHSQLLVEINFLCVHKKLRSKRLAPVLIKEVTRRVHMEGIYQAVYTAGVTLPKPISTCRYYHRSLNPKKLIETQFSHLSKNMTMARTIRLYKLPDETETPGLRQMAPSDVPQVTVLLNEHMKTYKIAPNFSEEEVRHWLLPLPSVVCSYVVENPASKKITEFISFYSLPSTVIGNSTHTHINAAYLYYYVPSTSNCILSLLRDALILARQANFDVFNCLDLMANERFIGELKFGKGDGNLNYYLYNYRCKETVKNQKPDIIPEVIPSKMVKAHQPRQQRSIPRLSIDWRPPDSAPTAPSKSKTGTEAPTINPTGTTNTTSDAPKFSNSLRDAYLRLPPRTRVHLSLGLFGFACFGVGMTYYLEWKYPAPARQTRARSRLEKQLDEEAILEQAMNEDDIALIGGSAKDTKRS